MNLIHTLKDNLLLEHDRWLLSAPLALGAGIILYFQWSFEPDLWALAAYGCA